MENAFILLHKPIHPWIQFYTRQHHPNNGIKCEIFTIWPLTWNYIFTRMMTTYSKIIIRPKHLPPFTEPIEMQNIQFKKRIDIFCSTSHRSNALQKSSNDILPCPHWSASIIVRSAMLINWSWLIFAPTIMCNIFNNSSREIDSSSSKSYIRNATGR